MKRAEKLEILRDASQSMSTKSMHREHGEQEETKVAMEYEDVHGTVIDEKQRS